MGFGGASETVGAARGQAAISASRAVHQRSARWRFQCGK